MHVIKKQGERQKYTKKKIEAALKRASKYASDFEKNQLKEIVNGVDSQIKKKNKDISTDEINGLIESYLARKKYTGLLEAYVHYRIHIKDVFKYKKKTGLEIKAAVDGYTKKMDWKVKENSNADYSFSGLMGYVSGKLIGNYTLNEVYPREISEAHREGIIHIHDLGYGIVAYCCGWSLEDLIKRGFGHVPNKISSSPAKHFSTLVIQMVNFIGVMQMEHAGAQAFSSVDTYMAPFIRRDKLSYKEVTQQVQQLVYSLNVPSRWGSQAPFTNITLDWICPNDMKDKLALVGGVEQEFTYGDCQEEMNIFNKALLEVMLGGDANGRIFYYPIPTYNITKEFDWKHKNVDLLMEVTRKYGYPYFANFVSSDMKPEDARSMCCRLRLDLRELTKRNGGLFGAGEKTGSIGVVTINLARIGYEKKTKKEFLARLRQLMELARDSLEIKRKIIHENLEEGLMPYTKVYLGSYKNHFSTIGVIGMHEACLNFLQKGIDSKEGKVLATTILEFMREVLSDFQVETKNLYNLEATPAESTSYRLAKLDKKKYPDIITSGDVEPMYTNSTQLPVEYTEDVFEALEHQSSLQELYTGGTVLHTFLKESVPDIEGLKKFIQKSFKNYGMPYLSITPTFSICKIHGYIRGEHFECPLCKEEEETRLKKEIRVLEKEIQEETKAGE